MLAVDVRAAEVEVSTAPAGAHGAVPPVTPATRSDAPRARDEPVASRWYGWQIALFDGASAITALALTSTFRDHTQPDPIDSAAPFSLALVGVGSVASFAVHGAHGDLGLGFTGVGLRLLSPPITALLGLAGNCLARDLKRGCSSSGASAGFAVGSVGASLLDITLLAHTGLERPGPPASSYAWQTLTLDAAGLGLGAYGALRTNQNDTQKRLSVPLSLGLGAYLVGGFGAPVVHAAHGRVGIAFADAGMRLVGVPILGFLGLTAFCAASGGRHDCTRQGFEGGFLGAAALAATIDALAFARERAPVRNAQSFAPFVAPRTGGWLAGASGFW